MSRLFVIGLFLIGFCGFSLAEDLSDRVVDLNAQDDSVHDLVFSEDTAGSLQDVYWNAGYGFGVRCDLLFGCIIVANPVISVPIVVTPSYRRSSPNSQRLKACLKIHEWCVDEDPSSAYYCALDFTGCMEDHYY